MKKNYILLFAFILSYSINAQTTTILSGLSQQDGKFELVNHDLYIVQEEFDKIIKIDISQSNPTATDVITGLNNPKSIVITGNTAYIAETYEDEATTTASIGRIRKFDLSTSNPTPVDVLTNLNAPEHLEIIGNDLHFLELNITSLTTFDRDPRISVIDITDSSPTINTYISGLGDEEIFEFTINNNDIYISQGGNTGQGKILKGNINNTNTPIDFLTTSLTTPNAMIVKNNELYFSDLNLDLAKIDLTASSISASNILTIANTNISDMDFDSSGNLYLMDRENGEVLKVDKSTLSIQELNKNSYSIYPNPAKNIINIRLTENNQLKNLNITNLFGQKVYSTNEKNIDVSNLQTGIYILNVKTEKGIVTEKIIKQ